MIPGGCLDVQIRADCSYLDLEENTYMTSPIQPLN